MGIYHVNKRNQKVIKQLIKPARSYRYHSFVLLFSVICVRTCRMCPFLLFLCENTQKNNAADLEVIKNIFIALNLYFDSSSPQESSICLSKASNEDKKRRGSPQIGELTSLLPVQVISIKFLLTISMTNQQMY